MALTKTIRLSPEEPEEESREEELREKLEGSSENKPRKCDKYRTIAIIILIIAALVWVLYYFNIIPQGLLPRLHSGYQAVFLTNGQVYFGKLYKEHSRYPTLREIYYLQVSQAPQPIQPGETPPANINLVKLGGELHGPDDEMRINRDQILFIEDLKSDSRVVQAIQQFQAPQ